jgi:hypothetical protein
MSKRGVAILIKNELDFELIESRADINENILVLFCKVKGKEFVLGSIYGPNKDEKLSFTDLERLISGFNCRRIVVGGDWNLTPCKDPAPQNPDTYKMAAPPEYKALHVASGI